MEKKGSVFVDGIEITSVGSFIEEIKKLKENTNGESTNFYFRGQEVDYWDIQPSIFRNDMLSVEDKLMQTPLQQNPFDFRDLDDSFDIMTKYQHYGMCTRLLDLTTNPLVALYFACKIHLDFHYLNEKEPSGVVYFSKYYPTYQNDINVKIITFLASCDLSKCNRIIDVLDMLEDKSIITSDLKKRWLDGQIEDFIKILQNNYLVIPTYSNERLRKQNGVFLLVSMFTVDITDTIKTGIISKTKKDLREEFDKTYFYILGENKRKILKELDLLGINESTLFPELEHQLSYIKFIHQDQTRPVSDFNEYKKENKGLFDYSNVDENNLNFDVIENVKKVLKGKVTEKDEEQIVNILRKAFTVDWYKRENTQSKLRRNLSKYCLLNLQSISSDSPRVILDQILDTIRDTIINNIFENKEGE